MITAIIGGPAAVFAAAFAAVLSRPYRIQPKGRHARPPVKRQYRVAVRSHRRLEAAR